MTTGGLFTGRALDAANLNALLARHDQETAAAAQQGVQEKYPQALLLLDVSDATIRQTKAVRDRLAATTDVETLTRWIERAEQYDAALRHLYEVLVDADGKVDQGGPRGVRRTSRRPASGCPSTPGRSS